MADLFESLKSALSHHQAKRFSEAEALYRAVLATDANQPNALYLYGLLCLDMSRFDEAIDLLTRADAHETDRSDALFNLGNAYYRKGDLDAAIARYREVTQRRPGFAEAHANLARALQESGKIDDAIGAATTAVSLKPTLFEARTNLGTALLSAARMKDAIDAFEAALALRPKDATAHANLANAKRRAGLIDAAAEAARAAIALNPNLAEGHAVLGMALRDRAETEAAIASLERAVALKPGDAQIATNLGNVLVDIDRIDEAEATLRRAVTLAPKLAEAHSNLGAVLTGLGRFAEAIAACDRAIALQPDFAEAHWNQGFAYLLSGDLARGWEKYEWRKRHPRFAGAYRHFPQPVWEGQDLAGRTLLVHAEQGLGDSLQLIRYAALLADRGARVIVACDKALIPLLTRVKGVAAAVDKFGTLPSFDLWIDQMSLPRIFGTHADNVPIPGAYLAADPERVAAWRRDLRAGPKFGLVWAGNPAHSNDRRRSIPVALVRPLLEISGITAISLQVGARSREIDRLAPLPVIDATPRLTNFDESAALVANLDLVITVDTAVAHLTGGLGVPTWVMLPFAPDWRWITGRDDTPWYGSMRLLRQQRAGDWQGVIARAAADLKAFASGDRRVLLSRS